MNLGFLPSGAGASGWPQGGRNLLAKRSCCERQRRLVYLGQGELGKAEPEEPDSPSVLLKAFLLPTSLAFTCLKVRVASGASSKEEDQNRSPPGSFNAHVQNR